MACAIVDVSHDVVAAAVQAGDLDRAARVVEVATNAAPFDEVARVDHAAVLVAQGHDTAARKYLDEAVVGRSDDKLGPIDLPDHTVEAIERLNPARRNGS